MSKPLRVLLVEDSEDDALLLQRCLRDGGFDPAVTRVDTPDATSEALSAQEWDLVLADHTMPHFSALEALRMVRARSPDMPLIIVSGTIGEDAAVALMRGGAHDYVRKDNLTRLVPAVEREVHEAAERRARRRAEEELDAANRRLLLSEIEKKRFYREVIRAVTQDKLHLVDADEIPAEGRPVLDADLGDPDAYRSVRERTRQVAEGAGMAPDDAEDMVLGVGEAAINAVKHAGGGHVTLYTAPDRVIARVADHGPGIRPENIPATLLLPGFSTTVSLGMGFTIMLQLMDRVWLATGPDGTTVQVEKLAHPEQQGKRIPPPAWAEL